MIRFQKASLMVVASALCATSAIAASARAPTDAEERAEKDVRTHVTSVKLADVPAPVRNELRAQARYGGRITELRRVKADDGSVVYKAEIVRGGEGTDIALDKKGDVISRGVTHNERDEQKREQREKR